MRKMLALVLVLVVLGGAAGVWTWYVRRPRAAETALTLYGNVDLRLVELAFNGSEQIATLRVEEGDRVRPGQVLATLETDRLEASVAHAEARRAAQQHVLERLMNGSRPEEIEQARAEKAAAQARVVQARLRYAHLAELVGTGATTQLEVDDAKAALDVAVANERAAQETLKLVLAGPRVELIEEARATLQAFEAELRRLQRQLADATLLSPADGIIRKRILEPGEMAAPERPVFTIAKLDPKWVRAYVPEPDLGRLRLGRPARVLTDSAPGRELDGWVGFISPVAEFTPKSIETPELRTSLVYEVRVHVRDPDDALRLGMPVTVRIDPDAPDRRPDGGAPAAPATSHSATSREALGDVRARDGE